MAKKDKEFSEENLEDKKIPEEEIIPEEELENDEIEGELPFTDAHENRLINELSDQLASEKESKLRILAEYDNFRKRSAKEREFIYADVRADTAERFLSVYDNLERALVQECADEAYKKGIELIMSQLLEIFKKLSIKQIPALGESFNPELHNAVMHIDDEEKGEGEIVEEFQKGFMMGEKVLRFSAVKVAN
ncbi:nucleotide exchange factor GrpE [Clostridiaceae bacterium OttesenSCG-928-D20]|nr:nucleotide exchange factor GrpE [Clostridiaceae bacterium OttesenSCG-928-D20]